MKENILENFSFQKLEMIRLGKLGRAACPQRFLSITGSFAKFEDGDNAIDKVLTSKTKARMMQTVKQIREESEVIRFIFLSKNKA